MPSPPEPPRSPGPRCACPPALQLYRKHGFVTTRLGDEVAREAGDARADIEMVLSLSGPG